jgi:hypothetical protein
MVNDYEINVFKALDFIRDHAEKYAQAKSNRVQLEEMRKVIKAQLMQKAQQEGATASATQERDAYAHPSYAEHLKALGAAVEEEERLRWMIEAAKLKVSVWQSLGANARFEAGKV